MNKDAIKPIEQSAELATHMMGALKARETFLDTARTLVLAGHKPTNVLEGAVSMVGVLIQGMPPAFRAHIARFIVEGEGAMTEAELSAGRIAWDEWNGR